MPFGLYVAGSGGNLLLGDGRPVLRQLYKLGMIVTYSSDTARYGVCAVNYPEPITTQEPPMVFATPTPGATGWGIGAFSNQGWPGNWTGFIVTAVPDIHMEGGKAQVGQSPGWTAVVCTIGGTPSSERYGLRMFSESGATIFDSGWELAAFQSLMIGWYATGVYSYDLGAYWGNRAIYNVDADIVLERGAHVWGHADGDVGILISSLTVTHCIGDIGDDDILIQVIPMIGFPTASRVNISCSLPVGILQHPGTVISAINKYRLLTAKLKV